MSTPFPQPGDPFGSYRIHREVGRGAMGVVYEATSLHPSPAHSTTRPVALKLLVFPPLLPEAEREALIVRFAREARALAAVRHPNVVEVFEVGEVEGQPFLAMEFLSGLSAREWLARHGPMPPAAVISLGEQLCDALTAVHAAGIVHRDIKPDNVVIEADGTIRLTDFGIARMEVEASLTRTGGLVGSPAYMAPEQILGGSVDARADLFSAGVTLYQMLTGELPFQGTSIMEVAHRVAYEPPRALPGVAPALAVILFRALEKDPAHRFACAVELREALSSAGIAAGSSTPAVGITRGADGPQTAVSTAAPDWADSRPPSADSPRAVCAHHSTHPAVAACADCGVPLCALCVRHRGGRVLCPDHAAPPARPAWLTRLEVLAIGLLFALLLWSLYPLHW